MQNDGSGLSLQQTFCYLNYNLFKYFDVPLVSSKQVSRC